MPNIIDTIQLSGSSYDVRDKSATTVVSLTQQQYDELPSSAKTDTSKMYVISDAEAGDLSQYWTSAQTNSAITQAVSGKQDTLVSGTNIKTINSESILGSGNIDIQGGGKAIEAGRGISITTGETADTVSFNLPISAGTGTNSIQEGFNTTASGNYGSHAEGEGSKAYGRYGAHAEGSYTKASGDSSHAEGQSTVASGTSSHAEGNNTQSNGAYSHAEGHNTKANGTYSHAEGNNTVASGNSSHVEGSNTVANNDSEHASGYYNVSNTGSTNADKTLFSVGNGTSDNARHNAFEIRQNGDIYLSSGGTDILLQDNLASSAEKATWNSKSDFSGSYNDLTDKPTIPTVPTSNTAFTNDAGYATSGYVDSSVSGKLDTSVFETYSGSVDTALGNKQDTSGMTAYTQNTAFTAHTADTVAHTTQAEKNAWNAKLDTSAFNAYSASVQSIISDWVAEMIGVEYIQSTDGYQYINLGYVPSGSGIEIGGEIMIVSYPSTAQWMTTVYIAYTGENYEAFRMIKRSNEDGTLYCNHHTKASGQGQAMSMTLGNKYTFKFTDSEYQFGEDTYTNTGGTGTTNTTAIKLFGNGSAVGAISRIYSFYIKKNGEYVMNLIPVVKNGVGMMYDKISGQFFSNNGTGSFTFPS